MKWNRLFREYRVDVNIIFTINARLTSIPVYPESGFAQGAELAFN